jgi:polyhydroxybutyrate depolymerase
MKRVDIHFAFVLAAVTMLAILPPVATAAGAELQKRTLVVDHRNRSFLLYVPSVVSENDEKRPLVLVFHGGGGTARGIAREVGRSLHTIADREGFIVAYPDAVKKTWDFGAGVVSEALDVRIDDRRFFAALMDELVETQPVDKTRIFATGISRGGQASYFVACQFPDRIRAIAPVAMPMPAFMADACKAKDIGIAVLNGTDDPLVPYDGGQIKVRRKERGLVMSTDDTIDFWRQRNDCDATPTDSAVIDEVNDQTRVLRTTWEQCSQAPVLLYRIEGGGHTWPAGRQYLPPRRIGRVSAEIDGASEIWAFFSKVAVPTGR